MYISASMKGRKVLSIKFYMTKFHAHHALIDDASEQANLPIPRIFFS